MLQKDIINELQDIPEVKLIEIYNFIHSIRLKFSNEFQQPIIQPNKETTSVKIKFEETPAFNLWKDRDDMQDVEIREAFGTHKFTLVDRLGVWLSQRAITKHLPPRNDLDILELGCGFQAKNLIALQPRIRKAVGIDFNVADVVKEIAKMEFIE